MQILRVGGFCLGVRILVQVSVSGCEEHTKWQKSLNRN